jgi:hypothetical protein
MKMALSQMIDATASALPGKIAQMLRGFRSPQGEAMVLQDNAFLEGVIPATVQRTLSGEEMNHYDGRSSIRVRAADPCCRGLATSRSPVNPPTWWPCFESSGRGFRELTYPSCSSTPSGEPSSGSESSRQCAAGSRSPFEVLSSFPFSRLFGG